MKSNRLSIILATVLALVTGALVFAYTLGADNRALQGATSVEVYVATGPFPVGTSLQEGLDQALVKLQTFPASAVPEDAIKSIDDTNGQLVAISAISEGQMLQGVYFGDSAAIAHGLKVPDGMVALTLNMDDAAHVGTFLTAGSEVLLYDTYQVLDANDRPQDRTGILLDKVLVIAVGDSANSGGDTSKSAALITVAVTPKDSVKLVHASQTGRIYFSLLGQHIDASGTEIVTPNNLFDK